MKANSYRHTKKPQRVVPKPPSLAKEYQLQEKNHPASAWLAVTIEEPAIVAEKTIAKVAAFTIRAALDVLVVNVCVIALILFGGWLLISAYEHNIAKSGDAQCDQSHKYFIMLKIWQASNVRSVVCDWSQVRIFA